MEKRREKVTFVRLILVLRGTPSFGTSSISIISCTLNGRILSSLNRKDQKKRRTEPKRTEKTRKEPDFPKLIVC